MTTNVKILLCGDVEGKFNTVFNRVENIVKKSGPFDLLLCVGNFFGINNKEFDEYKNGTKKVPIPTYILGPNKEELSGFYTDTELCPNIYCLGKRGLYTSSKGLKIAYISGIDSGSKAEQEWNFTLEEVKSLRDVCVRRNPNFRGIDILLTSQWPASLTNHDVNLEGKLAVNCDSDSISWLALHLKPRYHISGLEGIYYERKPYRTVNTSDSDFSMEVVTRFIGLARAGNPKKEKWIHALSLKPIDKMSVSELLQKTTDETPCPYNISYLDSKVLNKKRVSDQKQYFYDMNSSSEAMKVKKVKKLKFEFDPSKCWFCLASPTVEKHLIITVGDYLYLTLPKGGLVDEHLLICPIEHYQCILGQSTEVLQEIKKFKEAIRKFYERNNNIPVFFERNYKTSHMQIQCIPVPESAQTTLLDVFQEEAIKNGFNLEELNSHNRLDQVIPTGAMYFTVELPRGNLLYTKINASQGFPINFGREVLASRSVLNKPDSVEWKDCILKEKDEADLAKRIGGDFKPYDFVLTD